MRKLLTACAGIAALSLSVGSAWAGGYEVSLNQTEVVYLPEPAAAVIVGNPEVADISVHSSNTIFLLGRGYGTTNIVALNAAGQTILNSEVRVAGPGTSGRVRLINGGNLAAYSFACQPRCFAAPVLGDVPSYIDEYSPESDEVVNTVVTSRPSVQGPVINSVTEE